MKKILIIMIVGIFLLLGSGIIISQSVKNKDLNFENKEKQNLESYEITNPSLSECKNIDGLNCVANLYQKSGINKNFKVEHKYCIQYDWNETMQENTSECVNYYQMDSLEIESNLEEQVETFLKKLSEIKDKRDLINDESLSDGINFIIKEKK